MDISQAELGAAFDLLRQYSTLTQVSQYLERRELPSTAMSWPLMYEKRLLPALQSGRLTRNDIIKMVRDAEEYGKQHVFLFKCAKTEAMGLMNTASIKSKLKKLDLESLQEKPLIIREPRGLQLVDVRLDEPKRGMRSLIIKAVDVRTYRQMVDRVFEGNREIVTYETEKDRAVNIISVREDGVTEVRIQSSRNTLDYATAVEDLFTKATGIIERIKFGAISLTSTRLKLVKDRKKYSHLLRFADTELRDKEGNIMSMASGSAQQNLYTSGSASDKGLDAYLSVGVPTCDEVDCFWIKRENTSVPSTELHTFIGGANNEFVLTARCDRANYEYVLAQILNIA